MHRSKKKRNLIIFSLVGILICMVAGYAAFQTQLEIKGTSKVTSNWDIRITNVTDGTPTGTAENTVAPSWTNLTASMEADLYGKGDAMEYDVTIENKGTIDAKLDDITTNIQNANSDAVNITFSGYTKGEKLLKGESKIIHVKIEYNPNYTGGETSSEVEIDFNYTQNNNETENPENTFLLTYDYQTNGGTKAELNQEYLVSGSEVNLENTATKEGYTFIGWNTDKDAEIGMQSYQMPNSNTTLYAIYSKDVQITYQKGENIESIEKETDTCTLYNNDASCEITLPTITASSGYEVDGWYNNETKVGVANDKYQVKTDTTLIAKTLEPEPIIQSYTIESTSDFHAEEYRTNIKTINILDNKTVPENAVASWDVSDKKNGSVMAWVVENTTDTTKYDLYIGGNGGVIANVDSGYLFYDFNEVVAIDVKKLNTSNVINMHGMFDRCVNATSIDVSNFNTKNVTDMAALFSECHSLQSIEVSNFDTSNVTNMSWMFNNVRGLTNLDISNFDTSKVTSMKAMFWSTNITNLDLSGWDTSSLTTMESMFSGYSYKDEGTDLTTIDISGWDTSKVKNMRDLFAYNYNLQEIIGLETLDTSSVENMNGIFGRCHSLKSINISNFDTSNVTNMAGMFYQCYKLTNIDVSSFDTSKVTNMNGMFRDLRLKKLALCNFDTSNVTNMANMFDLSSNLEVVYVGPLWTMKNVTNDEYMFSGTPISSVTQSNNCEVDAEDISLEVSTTSTTNSITVVASAQADSGIDKYEYSKDGGSTWETGTSNTYTFTGLTAGTGYDIKVRVTSKIGKTLEKSTNIDITDNVVTTGDGLYADEYEEGKYTYKGTNPNNYIIFNNEMWRIIAKDPDGTYKIIKNESLEDKQFDATGGTYGSNSWSRPADLNTYLNNTYYNTITTNKDLILTHNFSIGAVNYDNNDMVSQISDENSTQYKSNIGLISISEYLRANSNKQTCSTFSTYNNNYTTCRNTNWMFINDDWWSITPYANNNYLVIDIRSVGYLRSNGAIYSADAVRPALYLSSDIILSGAGTQDNPYKINQVSTTSTLEKPAFTESGTTSKTVTINYPEGCGSTLTCTYQKDNGTKVNVTSAIVNVQFPSSGSLVATVTDGTNTISSSYTITIGKTAESLKSLAVTSGDGLYADEHESGRYLYKGSNPNNYMTFNDELWRIISVESDGTIKILKNEILADRKFDSQGLRDSSSNGAGGTYCANGSCGCNAWAVNDNFTNGSYSGTVLKDAEINTYLNGEYYNGITDKDKIVNHNFSVGGATYNNNDLAGQITGENSYTWNGKIGLITVSEYIRANSNQSECGTFNLEENNYSTCKSTNWMFNGSNWWTLSPRVSYASDVLSVANVGHVGGDNANYSYGVRPALYLSSDITLNGTGESSNPYTIVS